MIIDVIDEAYPSLEPEQVLYSQDILKKNNKK